MVGQGRREVGDAGDLGPDDGRGGRRGRGERRRGGLRRGRDRALAPVRLVGGAGDQGEEEQGGAGYEGQPFSTQIGLVQARSWIVFGSEGSSQISGRPSAGRD